MNDRSGCLSGILKLLFLNWLFDWLQDNLGFGRGGAGGCGCGVILLVFFLLASCYIMTTTNWFNIGF